MIWQEVLAKIARVLAPFSKDAATGQGEINLAVSSTSWTYVVPTWMRGKYVELTAYGASCQVLFGTASSIDVVYNQLTSESSGDLTVHANTGRHVIDGQTRAFLVPANATHWSVEASGTGRISVGPSSGFVER
jgi:hypothetical protein